MYLPRHGLINEYIMESVHVLTGLNSRVKFMSRKIWCMRVVIEWDRVSVRVRGMKLGAQVQLDNGDLGVIIVRSDPLANKYS